MSTDQNERSASWHSSIREKQEAASETVEVVPVVAEEVHVGRRTVETGRVKVHKTVQTTEEVFDEPLLQETVQIERIPINRIIERPIPTRQEGDTTVVSLTKEVLVVEKRLMFTEELRITRSQSQFRDPQRIEVRSEEVVVERVPVTGS